VKWRHLIEREWSEHTKLDHYLAQLSCLLYELRFVFGGKPDKKPEDFLLKFTTKRPVQLDPEEEERRRKAQSLMTKIGFMTSLGLNPDGTKRQPPGAKPKPAAPKPSDTPPTPPSPLAAPSPSQGVKGGFPRKKGNRVIPAKPAKPTQEGRPKKG